MNDTSLEALQAWERHLLHAETNWGTERYTVEQIEQDGFTAGYDMARYETKRAEDQANNLAGDVAELERKLAEALRLAQEANDDCRVWAAKLRTQRELEMRRIEHDAQD
jgi:hypothetical protein